MIQGYKPSGYTVTYDIHGNKREGETRQCAHCQYTWNYYGRRTDQKRGFCLHCRGLLCGKPMCMKNCAPYSEIATNDSELKKYSLSDMGIYTKI